ncbi:MAG: hypothetical protein ACFFD2_06650 [Promethearchaeota archaeon]
MVIRLDECYFGIGVLRRTRSTPPEVSLRFAANRHSPKLYRANAFLTPSGVENRKEWDSSRKMPAVSDSYPNSTLRYCGVRFP